MMPARSAMMQQFLPEADHRFISMRIGQQLFGIPLQQVRGVMQSRPATPVPLAPPGVLGLVNLQGRIATLLDPRVCLGLAAERRNARHAVVVVEQQDEYYGLVADSADDVLTVPPAEIEDVPPHLPLVWNDVAAGVYRLQEGLLVLVNVAALVAAMKPRF